MVLLTPCYFKNIRFYRETISPIVFPLVLDRNTYCSIRIYQTNEQCFIACSDWLLNSEIVFAIHLRVFLLIFTRRVLRHFFGDKVHGMCRLSTGSHNYPRSQTHIWLVTQSFLPRKDCVTSQMSVTSCRSGKRDPGADS